MMIPHRSRHFSLMWGEVWGPGVNLLPSFQYTLPKNGHINPETPLGEKIEISDRLVITPLVYQENEHHSCCNYLMLLISLITLRFYYASSSNFGRFDPAINIAISITSLWNWTIWTITLKAPEVLEMLRLQ